MQADADRPIRIVREMRNHVKTCPGCTRHLWLALPKDMTYVHPGYAMVAFNRKKDAGDGLQPWCKTCDWNGKATLEEAWNALRRHLRDKEPGSLHLWTKTEYLKLIGDDPHCNWCGARCREWGVGHWLDRTSSKSGHIPSNCVPCCKPCNFHKGAREFLDFAVYLRGLLAPCPQFPSGTGRYPWGKIPWDDHRSGSKTFKRCMPPDLSEYVADVQQSMF